MTSFEDKYRPRGSTTLGPPAAQISAIEVLKAASEAAPEGYEAFRAMPHPEAELWIRPNSANASADVYLPYSYRNHMISDGSGFFISMHYSTPIITVLIHGRNLKQLVHLLFKRQIEWVAEYDPRDWPELASDAPCITGIEIKHAPRPGKKDEDVLPGEMEEPEGTAKH